ncbi:bifunctional 5,10-methylenetetrahydrofolate dehydrogenase/5,10-methenyltetrahydrofolate cyclohydrolase [Candidatus Uhrbacteria bacterium]|jgi:methylenetetrahydrofolate dehydrogenase (NADP+) / methenyltetrahydrofolate cyclohydrolase|nr:bifunctional 5,10-methylenetetrahydrofolate dehydrogenase/5,10-methenyltetrahydrofolate cyclohydrolase [Candidatus Uhrbacteria bacterium]
MTQYINGREIAKSIHEEVKDEIEHKRLDPGLAAVLVGDDEASHIYVRLKERAAKRDGIRFERFHLPDTTHQGELISLIEELNNRKDIHAILVQLPLPKQIDADEAILSIDPIKDVDGFHPVNVDRFIAGQSAVPPVLTQAIVSMLESTKEKLAGKHAIVIANSPALFAPPVATALEPLQVTTDWSRVDAPEYKERLKAADIIIVALGQPGAISKDMIKEGAILIDIGTSKVDGKVIGDVSPDVDNYAAWRSPSPGGIGPVTVATLMKNVLTCYNKQENRL